MRVRASLKVGELPARLANDNVDGGDVPARKDGIDHRIDAAGGDEGLTVSVAPGSQGHGLRRKREKGLKQSALLQPGEAAATKNRSDLGGGGAGSNRAAVEKGAAAGLGVEHFVQRGKVANPLGGDAVLLVG